MQQAIGTGQYERLLERCEGAGSRHLLISGSSDSSMLPNAVAAAANTVELVLEGKE